VQLTQPGRVQNRAWPCRLSDPQHVRGISPNRPRRAVRQADDQQQHPIPPPERLRREQPPEQRVRLRDDPHLARQDRTKMLQSVAFSPGTGKSHFVEALAHAAIENDMRVSWFTLESLTTVVGKAKVDGSVARVVARICSCDLIVVDDIGMLPVGQDAAEAFYRVVDAAYERRSVAVTSNIHPSGFDTIMPKTLATATVDRLLHHAHLVPTKGDSHRLAEALGGKGVVPLT
jgi:hypothetical protein